MSAGPHGAADTRRAQRPGEALRRLAPYFGPYRAQLLTLAVLLVLGTLTALASPYLLGVAVDQYLDPSGVALPRWLGALVGQPPDRYAGLARVMLLLAGTYFVSWAVSVVEFRIMVRVAQRALLVMRRDLFEHMQRLSLSFYDAHEAGDLMSRLTNDTQVINDMFGPGITRLLRMGLWLIGVLVAMFTLSWQLALASFAVLPLVLGVTVLFTRRARAAFRRTRETVGAVNAELQENIAGVREVQAFARESATAQEFQDVNRQNRAANVDAETLMALFVPVLDVLSILALAVVAGYGGYLTLTAGVAVMSVGVIVAFLDYVRRFYEPIRELAGLFGQLQSALAGAERVFELLDTPLDVVDAPDAVALPPVEGRVEFDDVSFAYVPTEPVLEHVSLTIEPGQLVAVVGPTGAGKTTLVNLLLRFYDVQGGAVRVDGHDVRRVTGASLRQQMAIVLQDTYLFSGTVEHNIRYGRPDATSEQVVAAAQAAEAHAFIERLPKGYQTEVGERGATLSQGHRQLLAIARAILADPRILILDEATSSVDTRTERLIQRAMERLMAGRTSLVIAHRLSTIRRADQIVFVRDGRIVERGTHEELLARRGHYYELYMSQFRRETESAVLDAAPVSGDGAPAEG